MKMKARTSHAQLELQLERLKKEEHRRERAEKALRQAEGMARALLNASTDSAILIDAGGVILAVNDKAVRLLILQNINPCGKDLYPLLPPKLGTEFKKYVASVTRTGEPIRFDTRTDNLQLSNSIYPVFDAHGNVEKLALYSRDVSAQQEAAEALRESEALFRSISASAQDALIMMDGNGNITYWNESAARIFGYPIKAVIGRQLHQVLVPARYRDAFAKAADKFRKTGQGTAIGKTIELAALRENGEEFPIELSLSSFKYKGQWHALGIVRDISGRKIAEQERLQKEKLLGVLEMAGAASHELNQPLQIISGYAELLIQSINNEHHLHKPVEAIKMQVDRLGAITEKITRITKYETLDYVNGVKIIDIHKAARKK